MKNLKLGFFSLLTTLIISVFLTSCEQENFTINEDLTEEQVQNSTNLESRYPLDKNCFVKLCYSSYLGRCGEAGGINYWLGVLGNAETHEIANVAVGFITSWEAKNRWENNYASFLAARGLNRNQISKSIYIAYRGLLLRQPDVGGGKYWTSIAKQQGLKTAVINIASSQEFSNRLRKIDGECFRYNEGCN